MGHQYLYWFFIVTTLSLIKPSFSAKDKCLNYNQEPVEDSIIQFWKRQEKSFVYAPQRDLTLMLGNTGNGKTALTIFLTDIERLKIKKKGSETVIVDTNERIGDSLHSKTIIPELMRDEKANVSYYDCPGFQDTRTLDEHVTIAYFLNKVFTYATSMKLVFAVDYNSVKPTAKLSEFVSLMGQTIQIINDVGKFHDGIAMIVTKLNNLDEDGDPIDDTAIFKNVGSFLNDVKKILTEDNANSNTTPDIKKFNTEVMKFIDILLIQENNEYSRIGLFRKPKISKKELEGYPDGYPMKNITMYQEATVQLKQIIQHNLKYVSTSGYVFGYSVSSKIQIDLNKKIIDLIENHLSSILSKMCTKIVEHYDERAEKVLDMVLMHNDLKKMHDILSKINVNQFELKSLMILVDNLNDLGIKVDEEDIKQISTIIECVDFMIKVSIEKNYNCQKLIEKIIDTKDQIERSRKWYRFLMNLLLELTKYNAQNDNTKKAASNLRQHIEKHGNEAAVISAIDADGFLKPFPNYDEVENMKISSFGLNVLKCVLLEAFESELDINYKWATFKLTAKGHNFKISDVEKHESWSEATSIEIFALNTLIVDKTINRTGMKGTVTIIAPRWEILGNIIMDGEEGKQHEPATAAEGSSGKPGLPGGPGGYFIGFGSEFINGLLLKVSANGGNGGPGQNGGKGANGVNGKTDSVSGGPLLDKRQHKSEWGDGLHEHLFFLYPTKATKPGNGGDGGCGGLPGKHGGITLIDLSGKMNFNFKPVDGSVGSNGAGGPAGSDAKEGDIIRVIYQYDSLPGGKRGAPRYYELGQDRVHGKTISGANGEEGKNNANQIQPTDPSLNKVYIITDPSQSVYHYEINEFKMFVNDHLTNNIRESELREFVHNLEKYESTVTRTKSWGWLKPQ